MEQIEDKKRDGALLAAGSVCAALALIANIADVALGFGSAEIVPPGTRSAAEWFALFDRSRFRALYELGLLNLCYWPLMIPLFLAIRSALDGSARTIAAMAAIASGLGLSVYLSGNAALPMAVLAVKYEAADNAEALAALLAAGETVLARGEDFTLGSLPGIVLSGAGSILIAVAMLRGRAFGKATALIGLIGFSFLMLFSVLSVLTPEAYAVVFYLFGMCGGLMALTWFARTGIRLSALSRRR